MSSRLEGFGTGLVIGLILIMLGYISWSLYRIAVTKSESLQEYKNMVTLLEKYKPSTVSTTLQTDDQFMKVLILKLSSDKDFVAKVAAEVKK